MRLDYDMSFDGICQSQDHPGMQSVIRGTNHWIRGRHGVTIMCNIIWLHLHWIKQVDMATRRVVTR